MVTSATCQSQYLRGSSAKLCKFVALAALQMSSYEVQEPFIKGEFVFTNSSHYVQPTAKNVSDQRNSQ